MVSRPTYPTTGSVSGPIWKTDRLDNWEHWHGLSHIDPGAKVRGIGCIRHRERSHDLIFLAENLNMFHDGLAFSSLRKTKWWDEIKTIAESHTFSLHYFSLIWYSPIPENWQARLHDHTYAILGKHVRATALGFLSSNLLIGLSYKASDMMWRLTLCDTIDSQE